MLCLGTYRLVLAGTRGGSGPRLRCSPTERMFTAPGRRSESCESLGSRMTHTGGAVRGKQLKFGRGYQQQRHRTWLGLTYFHRLTSEMDNHRHTSVTGQRIRKQNTLRLTVLRVLKDVARRISDPACGGFSEGHLGHQHLWAAVAAGEETQPGFWRSMGDNRQRSSLGLRCC